MKAHYRTRSGRLTFEIEGDTPKKIFKGIAELQEVFEADSKCGCCQSEDIVFRVRKVEANEFYELSCNACRARLSFGQLKSGGGIWAKRYDDEHKPLPNRGWEIYRGNGDTVAQKTSGGNHARNAAR
jgi:hypothetical protein